MTRLTALEAAIWKEWNDIGRAMESPVRTIARRLGLEPAEVAFVVYPAEQFGRWDDDQEPDLD